MRTSFVSSLSTLVLAAALAAQAPTPEPVDAKAVAFFLDEGLQRSQVMEHLSWLCDVHGPRVTGSQNLQNAQKWAIETFAKMGLGARAETWGPFGRGWKCESATMQVLGDNPWPVLAYAKVWSPGIARTEAEVVHVGAMTKEAL